MSGTVQTRPAPPPPGLRLEYIFRSAPLLGEAFTPLAGYAPNWLERDGVVELVCALYVAGPDRWRNDSLPLAPRLNAPRIRSLWNQARQSAPFQQTLPRLSSSLWERMWHSWLLLTGQDLEREGQAHPKFFRKSHRLLAEAVARCLISLSVKTTDE